MTNPRFLSYLELMALVALLSMSSVEVHHLLLIDYLHTLGEHLL